MGGRPPPYGIMSEYVSEESSPLLANLGLTVRVTEPFFAGTGRFTTFTFFTQPRGYSLAYKYHPFSFSCHSNMVDLLCFLAYATTDFVGSNNLGLAKIMAWRPSKGIRENPRPPNNSYPKEIITACKYLCNAVVQRPSLCEPGMVTVVKCLLQSSKAQGRRKGQMDVVDSKMAVKSSSLSWSNPNSLLTLLAE